MQDNRNQLKDDRRGIADLPVKLLVIMVVLCVSIPVVANAAENSHMSMMGGEMDSVSERIMDSVAVVYYSGSGSARTLDIGLPQGCEIRIGGEGGDAYSVRGFYDGDLVTTRFFERPAVAIGEEIILTGSCVLKITCLGNNGIGMTII